MAVISSVFLGISLVLAVVVGAQTRAWTWGPAMLALAISVAAAFPAYWRKPRCGADAGLLAFAALVVGWFGWRAWISPVAELGQADLALLAGTVGAFLSLRGMEGSPAAGRILMWGLALLLLANVVVIGKQVADPTFVPIFRSRPALLPSGFYSHYNEAANFLIGSALLVGAAAMFGNHRLGTRIVWGFIAVCGLAAVYFTRSRGGILGAGIGCGVFAAAALVIGHRKKARWFAPAVIAVPIVGLLIGGFVLIGWLSAQDVRNQAGGVTAMMDNSSRLYLLGIALSCVALHPVAGGGSRSFSWESFQFFEGRMQGDMTTRLPEQVHNELLQAATDYGIIGAGLLIGLLVGLVLLAIIRLVFSDDPLRATDGANAWRIGGLAALAGMFVQSSFSFVFHLFPGILLLGIALGMLARTGTGTPTKRVNSVAARALLSGAAVACIGWLAVAGWPATKVTQILWPTYFGKLDVSQEARVDALTQALEVLPTAEFFLARAVASQEMATAAEGAEATVFAERAIRDYQQAEKLHPFNPEPVVNRAILLASLSRDAEAEAAFQHAIHLQGGMEPAFQGHFQLANALMRKALRQFDPVAPEPGVATMEVAAREFEISVKEMHWLPLEQKQLRVVVHETLGTMLEADGNYPAALQAYDFASQLDYGLRVHYRAGLLHAKIAEALWKDRQPEEALGHFIEARRRLHSGGGEVPHNVTADQRTEYLAYLEKSIKFLEGAKVQPVPVK